MSAFQLGFVKWFRPDGTGYIITEENPTESILVDSSVLSRGQTGSEPSLKRGQKVKFKTKVVLGRKVATDVQPL